MKKRSLSILLALLLLFSAACAESAENSGDETSAPTEDPAAEQPADAGSDEDDFSSYMPSGDYDGYEFRILKSPDISWCLDEVWAEGITGEAYIDAIYNRNSRIEDLLNVSITQVDGNVDADIKSSVTAGDDTYGVAYPTLIEEVFGAVKKAFPGDEFNVHIHDTRNMGIINSMTALQCGADSVQAAIAGLGGCPFAPGATGNTSSEDLVYMLNKCGYDTGVDFDQLLRTAKYAHENINGNFSGHHINIPEHPCVITQE